MHTFNTIAHTRVVIHNPLGSVDLRAAEQGETTVELLPRGPEGEAIVDEVTVECTESGGTSVVTVTVPNPRSVLRRRSAVDLQITAPEGCDVSVSMTSGAGSILTLTRGESGDVHLHGTVGDVDVAVPSGDLTAELVTGSLSFKTASGDLDLDTVLGSLKVRSVSGDVTVENANDDVSITLVSGDVSLSKAEQHVDVTSVSGDVTIVDAKDGATTKSTSGDVVVRRAWRGVVRAHTVSGDVTVGVPTGRSVSVEARSMSGTLHSDIDLSSDREQEGGEGESVRITANSVSGDVEIVRSGTPANLTE
jgi:DUF4097 and DUF4098 domain-containing protein YvlB